MSEYADISVRFFFILSGFILTHRYADKILTNKFSYKSYMIRRISKIYPLHLVLTALGIYLGRSELVYSSKYIPLHLILFQSWVPDYYSYLSFSGVSWFLSAILFCYMVFPILARHLIFKSKPILYNLIFIIIAIRLFASFIIPEKYLAGYLYISPFFRSFDFIFGVILYFLHKKGINKNFYTLLSFLSIGIYLYYHGIETYHLIWIPLGGIILLFIHYDKEENRFFKLIGSNLFIILGKISFSFFMLHGIIIKILYIRLPFSHDIAKLIIIFLFLFYLV